VRGSYARISVVLFAAGMAGTVANVSVTVVTSSLAREWGLPLSQVAVAVLAQNVAMAFVMPVAGLTAGRYGMRALLILGGATLGVSTILLLFAQDLTLLTIGRLGQGAGMAAVTPTAVQASNNLLSRADHSRALGWWSAANGAGLALGPVLGGGLFDLGGWEWVPIPTLLIALLLILSTIRGVPSGVRYEGPVRLFGVIMLSLMAGISVAVLSAISVGAIVAGAFGAVVLVAILTYSLLGRRRSELPLDWLRDLMVRRSGTGASVQMFINGMVQVGVPAWLVTEAITSSGGAGVTLLAMTLTMTVMGPITGRRFHISYARWFKAGALLCAVGVAGLALSASVAPWWIAWPTLVITGLGAGSLLTPSFQAFSATAPGKDGVGIAMYNLCRLSSFAVGGIVAAAAVDGGAPWIAFLVGASICLLLLTRSFPSTPTAAPVTGPVDIEVG
jgi:MFS family permease